MTSSHTLTPPALRRIGTQRDVLGECPLWDERTNELWWIDIRAPALRRLDPQEGVVRSWPLPELVGSIALTTDPSRLLVALSTRIALFDPATERMETLVNPRFTNPDHRFNDGRCDRQGRLRAGTMVSDMSLAAPAGSVYALEGGQLRALQGGFITPNGMAFSPDGRTMYHADTPTRTVSAYDYDTASGVPSGRRVFAQWSAEGDRPDGACVDSAGCYWSAFYRGGKVVRISPEGRMLGEFPIPAMCPTMCALGGQDLKTLFVTSARQQRTEEELSSLPQSGGIFAMRVDVPGLPEPPFVG